MLTPEQNAEMEELQGLNEELAAAMQSPWEAACVAAAFATGAEDLLFTFTMQAWIDLDSLRSPLLSGREFETEADFAASLAAFGHAEVTLDAEEASALADRMVRAVVLGFSTRLGMRETQTATGEMAKPHGFGEWLPLLGFLVAECGMSRAEALGCPVAQAFALCAVRRHLQGWEPVGTPYKMRDIARG